MKGGQGGDGAGGAGTIKSRSTEPFNQRRKKEELLFWKGDSFQPLSLVCSLMAGNRVDSRISAANYT